VELKQWFSPTAILKMVTHDTAQLPAFSGPRTPYPGRLGLVEAGALADRLATPATSVAVRMKDGVIYTQ
jgi:hypothetical protein